MRFVAGCMAKAGLCASVFAAMIAPVAAQRPLAGRSVELSTPLDTSLTDFLDRAFAEQLRLSPQAMTREGSRELYDRLDDYGPTAAQRRLTLLERQVRAMERRFRRERLGLQARVSFDLFKRSLAEAKEEKRWRHARFTFTALGAPTTDIVTFLVNNHQVESLADAEAYVARLRDVERVMREVTRVHRENVANGIVEPEFIFAPAMTGTRKIITGAPFTHGPDSVLWADFKTKLGKIEGTSHAKGKLLGDASAALRGPFLRGYEQALASLEFASRQARGNGGVWRLPNGKDYYAWTVRRSTTTTLSPNQVHEIGLEELKTVRAEMEAIAASLGGGGTLRDFLARIRSDPRFHYPNNDAGREQYLADARTVLAEVWRKAPAYFGQLPEAPLEVRAVEKWREATAPVAFYSDGSPDGKRPGLFYVNLRDLSQVLKTSLTGIACHEGVPGHHFQSIYANSAQGLPIFRRRASYGAYSEGWGLYSEQLCKEMGVYKDGYSLFSRLSGDARRAARLVADTGLNAKAWTREQAIAFLKENTLLSDSDAESEVDRYLTAPGQATSYKIGQRKIVELRGKAAKALGASFDLREFHDVVLSGGSLPLDMLEERIDAYIAARRGAGAPGRHGSRVGVRAREASEAIRPGSQFKFDSTDPS